MKRLLILLVIGALFLTNFSCFRSGSSAGKKLTNGTWYGDKYERYDNDGNLIEENTMDGLTLNFYSDGTVKFKENGRLLHSGEWELVDDGDKIHLDWGAAGEGTYKIFKLTDTKFIYGDEYEKVQYKR